MTQKARIFIGSSAEGANLARALQVELSRSFECTLWDQGIFSLTKSNLQNLLEISGEFDFAVLLITPDDNLTLRKQSYSTARDNIIFEAGLFLGCLGPDRTFIVIPSEKSDLRIPTDLLGISFAHYASDRSDGNTKAAMSVAAYEVEDQIKKYAKKIKRTKEGELTHAGALCFQLVKDEIHYLLVSSTEKRFIFPKGDVKRWEDNSIESAIRIAKKEAGVRGRIIENTSRSINYYNDDLNCVHTIQTYLLSVSKTVSISHSFRDPKWYRRDEAIAALTSGRDYNTAFELTYLMEWAGNEVSAFLRRDGQS